MATWDGDPWDVESDDDEFASQAVALAPVASNSSISAVPAHPESMSSSGLLSALRKGHTSSSRPPLSRTTSSAGGSTYKEAREAADAAAGRPNMANALSIHRPHLPSHLSESGWLPAEPLAKSNSSLHSRPESDGGADLGCLPHPSPPATEGDVLAASVIPLVEQISRDPRLYLDRVARHWSGGADALSTSPSFDPSLPTTPNHERKVSLDTPTHGEASASGVLIGGASSGARSKLRRVPSSRSNRRAREFIACLAAEQIDMTRLRELAWNGVPDQLRPVVWPLLLGHLPSDRDQWSVTLAEKRKEYVDLVKTAFDQGTEGLDPVTWKQIFIDVPRTNPGRPLWQRPVTQRSLERILYVWAMRHPSCGYVQGINDLATPFFEVLLSGYLVPGAEAGRFDPAVLPASVVEALEADTFWCMGELLSGILDNYQPEQPGIHRQVRQMQALEARIDPVLDAHLASEGVEYMQFSFRWMNCLLMREMAVPSIVRLWDTYMAQGADAFSDFHLYVCAVFLHRWADELKRMDFQEIIIHLQSLPTQDWSDKDAEMLLSEAFMYKSLFGNTAHLHT